MYIVPYAITADHQGVKVPETGLHGASVRFVNGNGLRGYYSELPRLEGDPTHLKRDAVAFHHVVQELLRQTAVIPFRFITALGALPDLQRFMEEHAASYKAELEKFAGLVQMEVRVGCQEDEPKPVPVSGTDYLQAKITLAGKLSQVHEILAEKLGDAVLEWREQAGTDSLRLFALVRRQDVKTFMEGVSRQPFSPKFIIRGSGPWPPTEFMALHPEHHRE